MMPRPRVLGPNLFDFGSLSSIIFLYDFFPNDVGDWGAWKLPEVALNIASSLLAAAVSCLVGKVLAKILH